MIVVDRAEALVRVLPFPTELHMRLNTEIISVPNPAHNIQTPTALPGCDVVRFWSHRVSATNGTYLAALSGRNNNRRVQFINGTVIIRSPHGKLALSPKGDFIYEFYCCLRSTNIDDDQMSGELFPFFKTLKITAGDAFESGWLPDNNIANNQFWAVCRRAIAESW
jgi:hypothetical protein